eukprot:470550-Hanusia_phi.AAC.13
MFATFLLHLPLLPLSHHLLSTLRLPPPHTLTIAPGSVVFPDASTLLDIVAYRKVLPPTYLLPSPLSSLLSPSSSSSLTYRATSPVPLSLTGWWTIRPWTSLNPFTPAACGRASTLSTRPSPSPSRDQILLSLNLSPPPPPPFYYTEILIIRTFPGAQLLTTPSLSEQPGLSRVKSVALSPGPADHPNSGSKVPDSDRISGDEDEGEGEGRGGGGGGGGGRERGGGRRREERGERIEERGRAEGRQCRTGKGRQGGRYRGKLDKHLTVPVSLRRVRREPENEASSTPTSFKRSSWYIIRPFSPCQVRARVESSENVLFCRILLSVVEQPRKRDVSAMEIGEEREERGRRVTTGGQDKRRLFSLAGPVRWECLPQKAKDAFTLNGKIRVS